MDSTDFVRTGPAHDHLATGGPVPRLRKGLRLHADDSADPYVFRLDLADLDRGTWR